MVKVALLGAAGGIGQPLALLLKTNKKITELSLFDLVATPGIAADLSHVNTNSKVRGYDGSRCHHCSRSLATWATPRIRPKIN